MSLLTIGVVRGVQENLRQDRSAEADDPAAGESGRAAVARLVRAGEAARAELGERIDEGREVARTARAADTGALQALNEALSTAEAHHVAPPPVVPQATPTAGSVAAARAELESWVADLLWMSDELARNIRETERSHAEQRRRDGPDAPSSGTSDR